MINGMLYVASGGTGGGRGGTPGVDATPALEAYDPGSDSWTMKSPMPTPRCAAAGGVVGGKLCVVGGIDAANAHDVAECYDPATDSWSSESNLPTPRSYLAAGAVNDLLYVVGGQEEFASSARTSRARSSVLATQTSTTMSVATNEAFGSPAAITHTKCYAIKDPAAKAVYTLNSTAAPEAAQNGCRLQVPAKMLCLATTKTNVSPVPPGGGPTTNVTTAKSLCYKVKCPKTALTPVPVVDQFGSRTVTPKVARLLCAPASPSGAFLDGDATF